MTGTKSSTLLDRRAPTAQSEVWRLLFEDAPEAMFVVSADRLIVDCNRRALDLLGYSDKELLIGKNTLDFSLRVLSSGENAEDKSRKIIGQALAGVEQMVEWDHVRADGSIVNAEVSLKGVHVGGEPRVLAVVHNITERKIMEEALKKNERHFRDIIENAPFGAHLYELDRENRLIFVGANPAADRILGVRNEEFIGRTLEDAFPPLVGTDIPQAYRAVAMTGKTYHREQVMYDDNGISGAYDVYAFPITPPRIAVFFSDITERKKVETALKESQRRIATLLSNLPAMAYRCRNDYDWTMEFVSEAATELTGYAPSDLTRSVTVAYGSLIHPDDRKTVWNSIQRAIDEHKSFQMNYRIKARDGVEKWVWEQGRGVYAPDGSLSALEGIIFDVTAQKHMQDALARSEKQYRTIIEIANEGIWAFDADYVTVYVNPKMAEMLGYRTEEMTGRPLIDYIFPEDQEDHQKQVAERRAGKKGDYERRFLRRDGSVRWMQVSATPVLDERGRFGGSFAMLNDITERRQDQEKIRASYVQLQETMNGIITTISRIVEMRDPYTAGHQRHVSQLAEAIGREMGLPEEQVNGIRIAGLIHDVGKLYVPSEILSKPGRLSTVEIGLIRVHPRAGYDMLRSIQFPWPVSEVAYQHQERLDGSGYPRGLRGDEILLETRIVSVADTVEAMTFHRPYRSVIGLDKALREIENGRGRLFDPGPVDACLRLFQENRFAFVG